MEFKKLKFPKRMGRPTRAPKPGERRVSLGLRVTADIKRKLDEAAVASGRSQSQEAELRIERSFEHDDLKRVMREALLEAVANPEDHVLLNKRLTEIKQEREKRLTEMEKRLTPKKKRGRP